MLDSGVGEEGGVLFVSKILLLSRMSIKEANDSQ